VDEVRRMYADIATVADGKGVVATEHYPHLPPASPNTIPVPARFVTMLGQRLDDRKDGLRVRMISEYPFKPDRALNETEKEALKGYQAKKGLNPDARYPALHVAEPVWDGDDRALEYIVPMVLNETCLKCHNATPGFEQYKALTRPGKPWQVGEIRGGLAVLRPLKMDTEAAREQLRVVYGTLFGAAAGLLLVCGVALRLGRRRE
jgi:hypothetical protein